MMDWGLTKAAKTLVEHVCNVRKGEEVLIYADSAAGRMVIEHVAAAAHSAGGTVTTVWISNLRLRWRRP